ncbi:hypothetical protein LDVICp187 [lymphocystis disease virus-China]|uniref:Uncharacterized protein n=1 Tax=lymphocystis disease virus-China TaxID=256729 RepID=Q677S6_9VIRU|nr:hypothetical protein LDVICp187 [lymphocystis disease virus-China]AAU11031.1 hypothetical protein [lymphocystis disease virus-China]
MYNLVFLKFLISSQNLLVHDLFDLSHILQLIILLLHSILFYSQNVYNQVSLIQFYVYQLILLIVF